VDSLDADGASKRVAGKQDAGIDAPCEPGGQLLLDDAVEPVVRDAGAKLVATILFRQKKLKFVNFIDVGLDPEELKAHLLCRECETRFSVNGEDEVLKHVAPKYVVKALPLAERMRVAWARDNDPSAPRHDARDFGINTDKFAYFALSIVWRRTIHEWSRAIPRWELGQFAADMRQYLLGEAPFPRNMSVLVLVCSDEASRRV
jgi:hypothetical protein